MSVGPKPTSVPPAAPASTPANAAASAAAAGSTKSIKNNFPAKPQPKLMKSPTLDSGKFSKAISSSSSLDLQVKQKPKKEDDKNVIKFREISSLLQPNEKILKMDTILMLRISNKILQRPSTQAMDDVIIDDLIAKHLREIKRSAVSVAAVITNLARVFLIDGLLNVLLVDLKANQGSDYLMYDYEFESVSVDDEEIEGEDVFGYLILELIKEGGDLVFLKRFSPMDQISLSDKVKVVDRAGDEIKLGKNYGWIDCLLMAKDMVSRETKPSTPPPSKDTTKAKKKPTKPAPKKTTKPAKPEGDKKAVNKFAYAAAAAAHK